MGKGNQNFNRQSSLFGQRLFPGVLSFNESFVINGGMKTLTYISQQGETATANQRDTRKHQRQQESIRKKAMLH